MAQDSEAARKLKLWEQHGQTLLLSVITAALFFASKALWDANALQATMVAEIKHLSSQVSELKGGVAAMQQHYVTRGEFSVHEQRLQALEARK